MREASLSKPSEMQELHTAYTDQLGIEGTQGSRHGRQAVTIQAQYLRLLYASCKDFNRDKRLHAAGIVPVN